MPQVQYTEQLFKKLRLEEGLSYSASAETASYSNVDVWYAYADTELETIEEVIDLIQQEIDQLVEARIGDEELELVKKKLLMSIAKGYESNSGIADYYSASLHEIEEQGALVREEEEINTLTSTDIQRVAREIFADKPPVIFHDKPSLTYTQLAVVLGLFALVLVYFAYRYFSRVRALRTPSNQAS